MKAKEKNRELPLGLIAIYALGVTLILLNLKNFLPA